MRRKKIGRKMRSEARAASDVTRQQLGWYVRNCAFSPAAGMLERVMLERLDRLKGDLGGPQDISNSMTIPRSIRGT